MDRVVVCVSDIHGCFDEFKELINKIQYSPNQIRLVLLGDLVDRGPSAKEVIAKAREMNLESVKGNHEDKILRFLKHEANSKLTGKKNPMKSVTDFEASEAKRLDSEDVEYLNNLPYKIDLGNNFYAIHAGVEPALPLEKQNPSLMMRVRYVNERGFCVPLNSDRSQPPNTKFWDECYYRKESIIYGHNVHSLDKPKISINQNNAWTIGVDTGCVFGGKLTAVFLHFINGKLNPEFVQVSAKQRYC